MSCKNKKIVCVAVVACMALVLAGCSGDSAGEKQHETLSLVAALDSANMMLVTPVGLGDRVKGKVVSGRLYRNFAQIIRSSDGEESFQDVFVTDCATGLRIQLYHDTVPVGELHVSDRIGRVGDDVGVWTPKSVTTTNKLNRFVRDMGVNFRPCPAGIAELAMDSFNLALKSMVFDRDTALGIPVHEIAKTATRMYAAFKDAQGHVDSVQLNENQVKEFVEMLRDTRSESFAGMPLFKSMASVTMWRDSVPIMKFSALGTGFESWIKFQLQEDYGRGGSWTSAQPQKMEAFFDRVKAPLEKAEESLLPEEKPVLRLK